MAEPGLAAHAGRGTPRTSPLEGAAPAQRAVRAARAGLLRAAARLCAGRLRAFDDPSGRRTRGVAQTAGGVRRTAGRGHPAEPLRSPTGEVEDYRIDAATPEAVDVFGRTGRDAVGRHILESYPSVAGEPLWQGYLQALETGVPFEGEPFAYQDVVGEMPVTATYTVRAAPLGEGLVVTCCGTPRWTGRSSASPMCNGSATSAGRTGT
ncbi:hypothetical protein LT493_08695 [Streptomyces tricolor]|nr:hypothetical protein [Streptomyces tricolor]